MNEFYKGIITRRSVRKFKNTPISDEIIKEIVDAGLKAPSGRNSQDTIILAITNKEIIKKLSKANALVGGMEGDPFYGAPAILVVLAKKDSPLRIYNGSLVMENLMLASHSLGLGSCWIHRAKETFEMPEFKKILIDNGINDEYEGIGNCIIGYIDGEYPNVKEIKSNRVIYIK